MGRLYISFEATHLSPDVAKRCTLSEVRAPLHMCRYLAPGHTMYIQ